MQKMNYRSGITEDVLTLNPSTSPYTVLFDGDRPPLNADSMQIITTQSVDEAVRYLMLLGDHCELYISPEHESAHPGLYEELLASTPSGNNDEAPFDTETAAALMRKLPLDLKSLVKSNLALKEGDKLPPLINKNLVHKTSDDNILISEPFSAGWLHYFNMFQETNELTFDHPSEHVQGLLLSEALRQAGIACTHLQGLPLEGKLVLLNFSTNYFSFIERSDPIILRAFSSFRADDTSEDKNAAFFIQVLQQGRICADSTVRTFACMTTQRQQQLNNRLEKIASRNKTHFENRLNRILESEPAR
jgi:hypothetical protein